MLIAGFAIYAGISHGAQVIAAMNDWFKSTTTGAAATKAPIKADKPVALAPLGEQISRCMKVSAGYQACMNAAGYAINPDWIAAHDKDSAVTSTSDFSNAIEVIGDQYRDGVSPMYKVPFWVPLASVPPKK